MQPTKPRRPQPFNNMHPNKPNLAELKALAGRGGSCLKVVEKEVIVLLHPIYSQDMRRGVARELEAMLHRYSSLLGGVPLAYENPRLVSTHGWLFDTNPFNHLLVTARFYIFSPQVGSVVDAVVQKKSGNHLGCLVHGTFNVSVPQPQGAGEWSGAGAEEGDQVRLTLVDMKLGYYIPYFKAEVDLKSVKEAIKARSVGAAAGTRIVFDEDSGISSNEADEAGSSQEKKNSKIKFEDESEEKEEGEEETATSRGKGKKKKDKIKKEACVEMEKEMSEEKMRKKKKRKDMDWKEPFKIKKETITAEESSINIEAKKTKKRKRSEVEGEPEESNDEGKHMKKKRKMLIETWTPEPTLESPKNDEKKKKRRESTDGHLDINRMVANIKTEREDSSYNANSTPQQQKQTDRMKQEGTLQKPSKVTPKRKGKQFKRTATEDDPYGLDSLVIPDLGKDWGLMSRVKVEPKSDLPREKKVKIKKAKI